MIEHVVLFKLEPEVDEKRVERILREMRIHLMKIPAVCSLRCGARLDPATVWSIFLLVELESREKLHAYKTDSAYARFEEAFLTPHVTDRLEMDFQSDPGGDPLYR